MIFPKKEILYAPMLGTLGGGSMRSFGRGIGGDLYNFGSSPFLFRGSTNNSAPGVRAGIQLSAAVADYTNRYPSVSWYTDTAFLTMTTAGYQQWTVPADGEYKISAYGAAGGTALPSQSSPYFGKGGLAEAKFTLEKGQKLTFACGHMGVSGNSSGSQASGGGGTFVVMDNGNHSSANLTDVLLVGGGGGGGFGATQSGGGNDSHGGNAGSYGGSSSSEARELNNGHGGTDGRLTDGGGGFLYNGQTRGTADSAGNHGYFGYSYRNGLTGGQGNYSASNHACSSNNLNVMDGGFGGGSGGSYAANGAGGGYTGGSGNTGCGHGGSGGGGSIINQGHSTYHSQALESSGNNSSYGKVEVWQL